HSGPSAVWDGIHPLTVLIAFHGHLAGAILRRIIEIPSFCWLSPAQGRTFHPVCLIKSLKVLAVNKQQLAAKIWESANQMRSPANSLYLNLCMR
ncbi:hypothetical protein, partial [Pseudomonas viridiflava]|uniref:hypothetical protein n=1 Tax=Pseudomonas viridiflava TaxID=33069 RepID=UPI00197FF4CD